ncbi:MAG TPA: Holliday junction resolvase RuvX, partial [Planctomycetota bacterium]|nr:Holliday junction resolvase RuvX [Planctomycetota bacterium]
MKVLAVDLGGRRTGLAISDPEGRLAMALPTLEDATAEDVARVAEEHQAEEVLVGLPLNMDGTVGPSARRAMDFAEELRTRVRVPVVLWDERLSSAEGHARL